MGKEIFRTYLYLVHFIFILCVFLALKCGSCGLPRWLGGKESACQCRKSRFDCWVREIPRRRKWQPTPVILPEKSHGQRNLVDYSPWGHKESDTTKHTYTCVSMCLVGSIQNFFFKSNQSPYVFFFFFWHKMEAYFLCVCGVAQFIFYFIFFKIFFLFFKF